MGKYVTFLVDVASGEIEEGIAVVLAGCDRIAFDPLVDAGGGTDAVIDAPVLGVWSPPTPVSLPTPGTDDDPTLTADMLELYWNRSGTEIWSSTRAAVGQPWSTPMRDAVLSAPAANAVPELSGDGLTIYFTSTHGGASLDIYQATRPQRTAPWGVRWSRRRSTPRRTSSAAGRRRMGCC